MTPARAPSAFRRISLYQPVWCGSWSRRGSRRTKSEAHEQNNETRMAAKKHAPKPESSEAQTDPAVDEFVRALNHPLKQALETVRRIILGVSPEIREGIKWNSPSFRTTEYFATINVRGKDVRLILHLGAKVKDNTKQVQIADPAGLLQWLAKDRCLVTLGDGADIQAKRGALEAIIRAWIRQI